MKRLVGLGACVYDTLITCAEYPAEDTKKKSERVFHSGGGPVGNALVIASKLGLDCSIVGAFADDAAGRFLLDDFKKYGVNTDEAKKISGATTFTSYIILSEKTKTRTCVFDRGTIKDDPAFIDERAIKNADILHLDGNYLNCAIKAAKIAKEHHVKICMDAGGLYEGIERLLPFADILIPSAEFAKGFTRKKDVKEAMKTLYEKFSPEILVVTDGSNGGYYCDDNGSVAKYDGVPVNAVDTNGAGDTFHGAFLAAYAKGNGVFSCCLFASRVAAYKCEHFGVREFALSEKIIVERFDGGKPAPSL